MSWNEIFADTTFVSASLDRLLHHGTVVNIMGESYRLKERKECMKQKQHVVNTQFDQAKTKHLAIATNQHNLTAVKLHFQIGVDSPIGK